MKNLTLIVLAVLSLAICSCKKDKQTNYYLTANKGNSSWTASIPGSGISNAAANKQYNIYANNGEEHLNINLFLNNQNQYELDKAKTQFTITVGMDAVTALYTLDDKTNNSVDITRNDNNKHSMTGNFNLAFKKVTGHDSYPTTVIFTNGKFNLSSLTN